MREWLIHLLGGFTREEFEDNCIFNYSMGEENAVREIMHCVDTIDGCATEEWCSQIRKTLNNYSHSKNNNNDTEGI